MFCPVDKAQEHNIKDIKVGYRSQGPHIDWAYLKKLHPAIHVIRALTLHMEEEFGTLTREKKHTAPKRELDVDKLHKSYRESGFHIFQAGREINSTKDIAADYATKGAIRLQKGKILYKWKETRTYERATTETWGDVLADSEEEDEEDDSHYMEESLGDSARVVE